jgi:glycosyltransferase involved in cell wall biosynthesis
MPPCLVVVPAFNEAASLPSVVAEIRRHRPDLPLLVIDDASTDDTPACLAELRVPSLRLTQRLGVGGAMRAGLRYALSRGYDFVVRLDGDGQHDPLEIAALLEPIEAGAADAAQGSRYDGVDRYPTPTLRRGGQRMLAASLAALTGQRVTDPTSGFWGFGPRAVRLLEGHHPTGYPEPELRLLLHRNGLRTVEVPARMRSRVAGRTSLDAPRAALALSRVLMALVVVPLRRTVEMPPR